ncbi:TRAP transporter small permease [Oceanibium sediminis]|uniref:TRAP transporter small permease n=1 Tax=Oceanibium sediminis TaxID=2026339 RepID=UPI000DD40CB7|nr:TRAP transporter small permease [Oceanibium sediminis]
MPRTYGRIVTLFSRLNLLLAVTGAGILFFAASIIFLEVASRALFGTSRLWVIEVSEYSLLYITFLGAPYLLEKNMHVTLDLVYDNLPRGWKALAHLFNSALGFAVCVLLTVVGLDVVLDQYGTGVRAATVMAPPKYLVTMALPVGMFLMAVHFLFQIVAVFRQEAP